MAAVTGKFDDEILTQEELARDWKVSKRFIEKARVKYNLPFFKFGRAIRFRRSEVNIWFEQRRQSA